MQVIEKWGSIYVPADYERYGTRCCICKKPAQYVDIFSEQGICSFECAEKHNREMEKLEIEMERKCPACPE